MSLKARCVIAVAVCLAVSGVSVGSAWGAFGIAAFDGAASDGAGGAYTQAAGHPESASLTFQLNRTTEAGEIEAESGDLRNVRVDLPPGLIGNPTAMPKCPKASKIPTNTQAGDNDVRSERLCPINTIVGTWRWRCPVDGGVERIVAPVFNLEPPPGVAAQFGFAFAIRRRSWTRWFAATATTGSASCTRNANQAKAILAAR